ncbi:hypothetical protein R3P38DRAFT_29917 [Favolaschia claudopus]|uniref:MARVEL domain-containing protein n=1 Tax=Favolaschia claudopus TaxID=2862362 RepID=A0AAW0EJ10_9AGAR
MYPRHLRTKRPLSSRRLLRSRRFPFNLVAAVWMSLDRETRRQHSNYHPFLFTMMLLVGVAEAGLTAFLINAGNASGTWPSPRYHSLLLLILFNAAWTVAFSVAYILFLVDGAKHVLANIASSICWLCVTVTLWGAAAGLFQVTRMGGICANSHTISRCRQSLTVLALSWIEFTLSAVTLFWTCVWVGSSGLRHSRDSLAVRDSRRMV